MACYLSTQHKYVICNLTEPAQQNISIDTHQVDTTSSHTVGRWNIIESWRWISYRLKSFGFMKLASNSEFGLLFGKHRPLYSSAQAARLYTIPVQKMRKISSIHSPTHWIAQLNISKELLLYISSNSNDIETLQRLNCENGDVSCTLTGAGRYRLSTQPHSFIHVLSG